jgi:hypothetical protein
MHCHEWLYNLALCLRGWQSQARHKMKYNQSGLLDVMAGFMQVLFETILILFFCFSLR